LRSLVLFLFFLTGGARRSIRIDESHHSAQHQSNTLANGLEVSSETRETLIPGGVFLPAGPQAGRDQAHLELHRVAPWLRFGPRHTKVALQAAGDTEADKLPSKARAKKMKKPKQKVKGPSPASVSVPEQVFFEGPPSITETFIPGASLFTVVGVIPFSASLARQAWTRYKITNRRIEVASGFQGKDIVQILYREIVDIKWLRRYGGAAGDLVFSLQDGSKLEMRSVPDFDRNLAFIMGQLPDDTVKASDYPDKPAQEYMDKVAGGKAEPPTLPPLE